MFKDELEYRDYAVEMAAWDAFQGDMAARQGIRIDCLFAHCSVDHYRTATQILKKDVPMFLNKPLSPVEACATSAQCW